ncbi:anti-sigma factor family protein [Elongatibacter sediminis]|uniref:Anti-sigma factor n=1 Tax=Elongatibacter sediminis TaxID=3119006 RepID=A0AAW9RD51_9GAMM
MIEERIADMIQADVDGELPAASRAELDAVLAQSGEARRFRDEMMRVARLMNELPPIDPPPGLTRRILDRIQLPSPEGWHSRVAAWMRPASYGMAVAAGVVIGIGVANFAPRFDADIAADLPGLVGTMVDRSALQAPNAADRMVIDRPGVRGEAVLVPLGDIWSLQFSLNTSNPVEIRVSADPALRFGGLADPESELRIVEVSGGDVRLVHEGRHPFVLYLQTESGRDVGSRDIAVFIGRDGETLFEGRLQTGG